VCAPQRPLHLLLLDEPLADDLFDRGFHNRCIRQQHCCLYLVGSAETTVALDDIAVPTGTATGFGYSLVYPGFDVEAVHRAPPQSRGLAMGAYTAFLDLAPGLVNPEPEGGVAFIAGIPDLSRIDELPYPLAIHHIGLGGVLVAPQFRREQEDLAKMASEMISPVERVAIRSTVSQVISLDEIPQSLATLAEGHVRGKFVARI
jgi:hypothetical protein